MADDLIFYTNPMSRGRIARWMLEEVGATYTTEIIEYGPTMKGKDYRAINPMGKVPAIKHKGQIVTETPAIIAYLADAFPEAKLAPPLSERAAYYRWLFYGAGPVEAALINKALGVEISEDRQRMAGYGTYALMVDVLEQAVSQSDYITGDTFTAADIYIGTHVGYGMQFGGLENRPAFEAYWARVSDRPARLRAEELDNAAMPPQQS